MCLQYHASTATNGALAAAQGLEGGCEFGALVAVEVGHALGAVQRDHHRPPHGREVHLRALEQVRQAAEERITSFLCAVDQGSHVYAIGQYPTVEHCGLDTIRSRQLLITAQNRGHTR